MRYLYFDSEAGLKEPALTYEMVYDSIINAPGGYEGPNENRIIARVLDKLDEIGTPSRRNNQDVADLRVDLVGPALVLEDAEYDLVFKVMKSIRWTGSFSRRATVLYDWLTAAPRKARESEAAKAT